MPVYLLSESLDWGLLNLIVPHSLWKFWFWEVSKLSFVFKNKARGSGLGLDLMENINIKTKQWYGAFSEITTSCFVPLILSTWTLKTTKLVNYQSPFRPTTTSIANTGFCCNLIGILIEAERNIFISAHTCERKKRFILLFLLIIKSIPLKIHVHDLQKLTVK